MSEILILPKTNAFHKCLNVFGGIKKFSKKLRKYDFKKV